MKRLFLLAMLIPALTSSDPGPATRYLMNEPATLFELGFTRAQSWIEAETDNFGGHLLAIMGERPDYIWSYALYEYDNDRYRFGVGFVDANRSFDTLANACKELLERYDLVMKVEISRWFSHFIDAPGQIPNNFFESLRARSKMECRVSRSQGEANVLQMIRDIGTGQISVVAEDE